MNLAKLVVIAALLSACASNISGDDPIVLTPVMLEGRIVQGNTPASYNFINGCSQTATHAIENASTIPQLANFLSTATTVRIVSVNAVAKLRRSGQTSGPIAMAVGTIALSANQNMIVNCNSFDQSTGAIGRVP